MNRINYVKDREKFDNKNIGHSEVLYLSNCLLCYEALEFADGGIGIAFYAKDTCTNDEERDYNLERKEDIVVYYEFGNINKDNFVDIVDTIFDRKEYIEKLFDIVEKFYVVDNFGNDYLPLLTPLVKDFIKKYHYDLPEFYNKKLANIFEKELTN